MDIVAPSCGILISRFILGLVSLYIVRSIWAFARLRHFGGPFWARFSDWPHSKAMLGDNCHEWYAEITNTHGSIARVAPNLLITSSPGVWAHVNSNPGYKRSDWFYKALRSEHRRDSVFTQTDSQKHERRRKQLGPGLIVNKNPGIERSIDECLQELLHLIKSKYISSEDMIAPVDLARKLQYFLLDCISSIALGKSFGNIQTDTDNDGCIKAIEDAFRLWTASLALGIGWLPQVPLIGSFFLPSLKDKAGFGKFMFKCFSYVDERAANLKGKDSDMLASFMRNGVVDDDLRSEALIFMTVGSVNPLGAISGTVLYILTNFRVYTKLQDEIDSAVRDGRAPRVEEGIVTSAQIKRLPYLQATIREGLRLWPPVDGIFARDVPPGGDTILVDGKPIFLPGGVSIGRSGTGMYRNKEIFGQDANAFRPERWFETDDAKLANMNRTCDMVFNHGKAQCLGKAITHVEVGKTIFELLRNFEFALLNPTRPWSTVNTLGLFIISDMWVQVTERTVGH